MTDYTQMPRPVDALAVSRTGDTSLLSQGAPCSGAFSSFPEIGDEVRFQRSPTHHQETGIVRGRVFGVCAIDIEDSEGNPLRLEAGEYEISEGVTHPPPSAQEETHAFECSEWPKCGCPAGTMREDCPGLERRGIR